jgi:hypothetical protein
MTNRARLMIAAAFALSVCFGSRVPFLWRNTDTYLELNIRFVSVSAASYGVNLPKPVIV